jgi:pyruvate dehydrogenase E2 component (dihydrolipoyllysine-residue acetyltransferase)
MATEIRMPRVGHSMTEGTLVAWLAEPGVTIHAGQILLTIETDKAEYEVEAPADGRLSEPLVTETQTVPVGAVLAWVLAPGEARPDAPTTNAIPAESAPRAARKAPAGRVRASPKARRRADERGVDLAAVTGSGPDGLVTEADVERAARAAEPAREPAAAEWNGRPVRARRRLGAIRRTTARRMVDAWTHVPHIVQMIDVDMEEVRRLRGRWKTEGGETAAIGYNDFIVKAAALALAEHPEINAAVDGDEILVFAEVNAGIAVDTARGLLVPVVRGADRHSLLAVSREAHRLAEKARGGGLDPSDSSAGTFTVSNLGGFGIRAGTPVLNPPEAVLVFVGAVEERPAVRDGAIVARPTVTLSIAYDHRVADGADAARVTKRIAGLLESPASWAEAGLTDGGAASKKHL